MKKFILIIIIMFLNSCGFTPIYSSKDSNYKIISFQKNKNNNLTKYIQDSIISFSNDNAEKNLRLDLNFKEEIIAILKDSKGDPKKNRITIIVDLKVLDKNSDLVVEKIFSENFEYNIVDNKFNLRQYEKNIKLNLVEEITQEIRVFLAEVK
tara:strand:- start:12 stop:467 length:456 start_codon:yes stop_codon:yes gene_type:complete